MATLRAQLVEMIELTGHVTTAYTRHATCKECVGVVVDGDELGSFLAMLTTQFLRSLVHLELTDLEDLIESAEWDERDDDEYVIYFSDVLWSDLR